MIGDDPAPLGNDRCLQAGDRRLGSDNGRLHPDNGFSHPDDGGSHADDRLLYLGDLYPDGRDRLVDGARGCRDERGHGHQGGG